MAQKSVISDPGGLPYRFLIKALIPLSFSLLILQALRELVVTWHAFRRMV